MLEVEGLRIGFGDTGFVHGVGFTLAAGQRLGLVGDSGSGKSLIALGLAGLLPPSANAQGIVRFDGAPLPGAEAEMAKLRRSSIAIVPQGGSALDPLLTVGQLLPNPPPDLGLPAPSRRAGTLTAAERQLLLIAMAVARQPKLLILDEPFGLLDVLATRRVVELLRTSSSAILLISHDLRIVASLCTDILILRDGKAVETGTTADIFSRPKEDYSKRLIAGGRMRARTMARSPIGTDLLDVQNLTLRHRNPESRPLRPRPPIVALDSLSFTLRRGEALAIIGPAGSGKTSLTRLLAGLDRASAGQMLYEHQPYRGRDLPHLVRHEISLVFADPRRSFSPRLTLGASVTEPMRLEPHLVLEEQADRLVEVVRAVGLSPEHLVLYPRDVALGELQKLAVARALITRPKLVILDEPTGVLDAAQRRDMLMMLNRLRADFGFSAIVTASDLDIARHVADRVLMLDAGRIIEEGKPADLVESATHPLTRAMAAARLPEVGIGVVAPVGL